MIHPIYFFPFVHFCFLMDHLAAMTLHENRSPEEHLEEFLGLAHQTTFPDDCLYTFLRTGLDTTTREQLSREGHRGSFMDYVEWVLVSCGSPLTVFCADADDTSPTPDPEPSQTSPCCTEH